MAPWFISMTFVQESVPSLCVSTHSVALPTIARQQSGKYSLLSARQQLSENATTAMNTHTTTDLLDVSFYMWSLSCIEM
jgi:hypothetical protein